MENERNNFEYLSLRNWVVDNDINKRGNVF